VPLIAFAPVHAPDAVHDVALVELQVSVDALPLVTLVGLADRVTVGVGVTAVTVTVVKLAGLVPPEPLHVIEYVALAVSVPVDWLPLAARLPLHAPDAVHEVALVELQVSVEALPVPILVGLADRVTVGALGAGAVTTTLAVAGMLAPPDPVHVSA
jgi:hypothetical protein